MHSKVIMRAALLLTGLPAWIACATTGTPPVECPPVALDLHTVRIEGWFAARADWKVNSLRGYENFNPFGKEEDQRCVTIVNDTGEPAEDFAGFDDKQVIVTGFALKYDDLPVAETVRGSGDDPALLQGRTSPQLLPATVGIRREQDCSERLKSDRTCSRRFSNSRSGRDQRFQPNPRTEGVVLFRKHGPATQVAGFSCTSRGAITPSRRQGLHASNT